MIYREIYGMKQLTKIMGSFLWVAGLVLLSGISSGCSSPEIGRVDTGLHPCPGSPNCVSSQSEDKAHLIEAFTHGTSQEKARDVLEKIIADQEGAVVITAEPDYLHIEFRSKVFGFVDDVEFWFPEKQGLVHVRSASRLGYSDLGVNEKRVEMLRTMFDKEMAR